MKKRIALSLGDREVIWMMRDQGLGIRAISRLVKRAPSIVTRELRRNKAALYVSARISALERARYADNLAKKRLKDKRRGKRKARPHMQVFKHISERLQDKWSPETIANTFSDYFAGIKISTSTIYRMIKRDGPELIKYLPEKGKKRRQRVMNRRGRFQHGAATKRHKDERPKEADRRLEPGHLEADSILSCKSSKAAILSIVDRKNRKRWYILVANLEAATIRAALVQFLHSLPAYARKSLTLDRGSEFAEWPMLEQIFPDLRVYFCTAYSPHEKGSVERSNRELRRFFRKGTDFSTVSSEQLKQAEQSINNKPMKCLKWRSSAAVHQEELAEFEKKAA